MKKYFTHFNGGYLFIQALAGEIFHETILNIPGSVFSL